MCIEVRRSLVHGLGVYATRPIKAGEIVLRWNTAVRVQRGGEQSIAESERIYLHPFDDATLLLVQPPERYVNHSCSHNTEVASFCDVAVRDISAGEEITSNYETDGAGLAFSCECGSACCRGSIGKTGRLTAQG